MSINFAVVSGNLTRDPEFRQTQTGFSVLSGGVAVNDRVKNQQTGQWEDRPNYVDWTVFGARAESLQRILVKGMRVTLTGRLRWSQWEAQDGTKRSKLELAVDEVELPPRERGGGAGTRTQTMGDQALQGAVDRWYATNPPQAAPIYDEDIPF